MTISKYGPTPLLSSVAKKVTWINIFIQFAFPISASIPANVFAKENSQENQIINISTLHNYYQVKEDDTPDSIAKKFNIKLSQLIEANPDYVSLVGKLKIKTGITLNIPDGNSENKKWLNNNNQDLTVNSESGKELAQIVVDNSSLLNKETDLSQYAISRVTNKANAEIEQWLNQFGHARVSLSTDKKFTLEGSSADLLIPLYDQDKNLVFSQTSYHRKDSRSQLNQGIGYRHFSDHFMVGINAFYDYDLSRYHSRLGLGAELWRDFLKFSANHYHRLSNWRTSDDVMDYNERPANGWDIRAEGYLPSYPQLGAKLTFEQYYGNEVGLFGKDEREKNPHAYTAGISYTPIPLLTFNAERKIGLHDHSDNKFDINLSYRLGESLSSQLNPDNVKAMRTLAGSRYDFVDRNNDIVLEYKKKTLVFLSMVSEVNGYAKEEKDLAVQVRTKYPLANIEWSTGTLTANGGQIKHNGNTQYSVILPRHITGSIAQNTYTISAVAIDEKGNRSDPVQSKVIVDQAAINTQNSLFEPKQSQLPADGHTTQQLILSVFDNDKLPVDIDSKALSLQRQSDNAKGNSRISDFSRIDTGKYQLTVTTGSAPEKLTLTPVFRDNTFNSATLTLVADDITAHITKGELTVIKDNSPADGKSQNKIKAIVTDINHNPIPNYPVSFSADNGATIVANEKTDQQGVIIVPITNTHTGISHIGVQVKDVTYSIDVNFIADSDSAYIPQQSLTITPAVSLADNQTEKTISLQVVDKQNNPVPTIEVSLSADNQAQLKEMLLITDSEGKASTTMISKFAGLVTVNAKVKSTQTQATTQFIGSEANGQIISITPSAPPYIADGQKQVTFTALVEDNFGNPLPHAQISWGTNRDKNIVKIEQMSITNEQGIATAILTSTQAISVVVTARINNHTLDATPITFVANNKEGLITKLSADKAQIVADTQETNQLTAIVEDTFGNKLPNVVVHWEGSTGTHFAQSQTTTDDQGNTQNTVTTSQASITTITAKLDNGKQAQTTFTAVADPQSAILTLTTLNNKKSAVADDQDSITVIADLTDIHHNPLKNSPVYWQSSLNKLSETITQTDDKGRTQVVISGTKAQSTTVIASLLNKEQKTIDLLFIAGTPAELNSQFTIEPQSIIANGQSVAVGNMTLRDKFDNPVKGRGQSVKLTGDNNTIEFSEAKEVTDGVYQTKITGKKEGISLITATIDAITATQPLGFLADQQTANIQSVTVIPPYNVAANGADNVTIRAQVTDKQGNTNIKDVTVGWITNLGTLSAPLSKTNDKGIAEITLSSRQSGNAQVTAMLDSQNAIDADHTITFNEGTISANLSTLTIFPDTIAVETGKATVTLTLKDKEGNLLSGLADKITLTPSLSLQSTISAFKEGQKGVYQAQISALKVGKMTLSAQVDSVDIKQQVSLTIIPNSPTAKVKDFTISDMRPHAGDTITYQAHIVDNHDNPVGVGVPVTWTTNEGSKLEKPLTLTDDKGTATVRLSRGPAGVAKVSATLVSGTYPANDVNFVADNVDENKSELSLIPTTITANGKDVAVLTLVIKDKGGNILPNQTVQGISNEPTVLFSPAKQVSPGYYEINVSGTKEGSVQLGVKVNGVEFKKHKTLQLNADASTWKIQSVKVDRTTMIAGETKGVNYQATIVDANNNILPNVIVSWKLIGLADDYDFSTYTDDKGIARTKVTSNVAGTLKMSAYLDLSNHKAIDDVTVLPADIDATKSTFVSSRNSIGGDDKDSAILTVKLVDKYNNIIDGKQVTTELTKGKANFTDNPLKPLGHGEYQTALTSNIKGDVTVIAKATDIEIAKPLTINVTIPKPEINFDKSIQQVVYTSKLINSLTYTGVSKDIDVMWSSSDPSTASIDSRSGKISLKKAGTVLITLQSAGNDHYLPAQNSYPLVIEKADPQLRITTVSPMTSVWQDGITHQVKALFDNPDVIGLPLSYSSSDVTIATIDNDGFIHEVIPGHVDIRVHSQASDKFLAANQSIPYKQDRARILFNFAKSNVVFSATQTDAKVQQPTPSIPNDANIVWSSIDPDVVAIKENGEITALKAGSTSIYLKILENKYYFPSDNFYQVEVRKIPEVEILSMMRRVDNNPNDQTKPTTTYATRWTPLYENDTIAIKWKLKPGVATSQVAVNIELLVDGKSSPEFVSENQPDATNRERITTFKVKKELLNQSHEIKLKVVTFDWGNDNHEYPTYYPLVIEPIIPQYMPYILEGNIAFITTKDASISRKLCQVSLTDDTAHVIAQPEYSLGTGNKKFLYPITISHRLTNLQGASSRDEVDYHDTVSENQSVEKKRFSGTSSSFAMKNECWASGSSPAHSGSATLITTISIEGKKREIKQSVVWNGDGYTNQNTVEYVKN